jgi:hypothetical protein
MVRRAVSLAVVALAVVSLAVPPAAVGRTDVATLDRRIERAERHVGTWFGRIERWYARIDRAAGRVDRLEAAIEGDRAPWGEEVVRRTMPRDHEPMYALAQARRALRATLKDPWARHVQAELDAWSAFLAELVRARERALRPPAQDASASPRGGASGTGSGPRTYEGWADSFLSRLHAPACGENLLIVVTWATAESTTAAYNPLATTRDMPGATDMNTVGVKHYVSLRQGLDASRDTLTKGADSYGYDAIIGSLRVCASAAHTARAINASAWCRGCVNGAYITGLLPIVRASYPEHAARLVSTSS